MLSMFFVDRDHCNNYLDLGGQRGMHELNNVEYQQAIYITSLPMFYGSVYKPSEIAKIAQGSENPIDWYWQYKVWSDEYNEEWESYSKYRDDDKLHPDYEEWLSRKPFDMTGSMRALGDFMLNLWNDSNQANFMRMIGQLDNNNVNVALCAIYVRMGHFKGHY